MRGLKSTGRLFTQGVKDIVIAGCWTNNLWEVAKNEPVR